TVCELSQVCVPLTISDLDENVIDIATSLGTVDGDTAICFTPEAYGTLEIVVTVTDECGATDQDTASVSIVEGDYASIQCPDGTQFASICGPDSVCIIAPITPADAKVTVSPNGSYNPETGEICVFVDEGGTVPIEVIAEAQCSSDTCEFNLEVDFGIPPELTCPESVDTLLCLVEPTELCFPVEVAGTGVTVNVDPEGEYQAGVVCVPISEAGEYSYEIIATGTCGVDTCNVDVTVTADEAPVLTLPQTMTFERCPDDTNTICINGIFATDTEGDVTLTQTCGPEGAFNAVRPDSGVICFVPEEFGLIEFCFEASDGCHTVESSFFVDIALKEDCDVCVRLTIDGGDATPVGLTHELKVDIETNDYIGGFDILLNYDETALSFQNARIEDGAATDWEYFTWNLDVDGGTTTSGLARFVGIADRNNGAAHPPDSAFSPQGTLFFVEFLVANDQNLGGLFVPVSFYWMDCNDNTFSDPSGRILYIDSRIFTAEGALLWDEMDDIGYPESARIEGVGAPDTCIVPNGDKPLPLRCIEFYNGGIQVIDPDSIDARGDINLNGLTYEIADAVVFTNYFIRGLAAFTINVAGQTAATDVNADGLTLTVSDLTLLIRVIVGDANPVPKTRPYSQEAYVTSARDHGELRVSTETVSDLGAAYLVYDIPEGVTVGQPTLAAATADFDLKYSVEDNQLKLLVYDIGTAVAESGVNELVSIPVQGRGELTLRHSELVDYQGRPYRSSAKSALPSHFELMQNYPNPFNPTTTISFLLPQAGNWNLTVYNITGSVVRELDGYSDGGRVDVVWDGTSTEGNQVASGVYFYRLDAATWSETKKMMLLK
ncbi:T9SS type A sorting domain-containing protein, partial [candidate division GN15 bacterium]|nr:T9SS type A sorting domain-containing protein [candidate division GN15 bacterium]